VEGSTSAQLLSLKEFFNEQINLAINKRNISTFPLVSTYLVDLLQAFMFAETLERETLAEMYLKAMSESSFQLKADMLKRLGDTSLYISGFFGDSLKKKVVDIDYYADLGGRAYDHLSKSVAEDTSSRVYREISIRFLEFVDVLAIVSQKALVQTNEDLLRLYDRYVSTGSSLARDQLLEKGLLPTADMNKKKRQ